MRLSAAVAALLYTAPAIAGDFGKPIVINGVGCSRPEDTLRLGQEVARNAQVIKSQADVLALAARERLACRHLYGVAAIYLGTVTSMAFSIGPVSFEIAAALVRGGEVYFWRPTTKPGEEI